jgi:hypothetical protein
MHLLLALALLLAAPPARADPVAGSDAPRFRAAVTLWLADDEAEALPALAGLAAEGNRAAQILLALVDRMPPLQGPWLATRPRAERLALMRAPGGLSGRSWLGEAAADEALARLWLARDRITASPHTALALAAIGEPRAARETLQAVAARQGRGFAAVADDPLYPPEMRELVWREWATTAEGRARAEAEIAALPPGDPQIQRYAARPVPPGSLEAWLRAAPLAAPLHATCSAFCPASGARCHRAAFLLVGGYPGLIEFGSPAEALVPTATWLASPRGRLALLRVAGPRGRFAYETAMTTRREDACLADALDAEVRRFRGEPQ